MSRPPMPPGTWGKIDVVRTANGTFQAETRYRFFSGQVGKQRARGASASAARAALALKLTRLNGEEDAAGELTRDSTVADLADLWLAEKELQGISATTLRSYRGVVNNHVLPAIGLRSIGSCRTSVLDRVVKTHAGDGAVKQLRNALRQMFGLAVRLDVLVANPMDHVSRISRPRRLIQVLEPDQVNGLRALIDGRRADVRPGPRMNDDLRDIVDLLLATGCRIGELLALTWDAVDLTSPVPTVTISGTIATEAGKGTFRQGWPKTNAGHRTLALPPFGVEIIRRRREQAPNPIDAVFATRTGTWHQVANLETRWGRLVKGTDYDWVTFHVFRRSVATMIDASVDAKAAAAQLGHSSEAVTRQFYIRKAAVAPDLRDQLQVFADEAN